MRFHGTDPQSIRARLAEIAECERYDRREFWLSLLLVNVWPVIGLCCIGWGLHSLDPRVGQICLAVGALIGTAGPLLSLIWLAERMR